MKRDLTESVASLESPVRHMRHPFKNGLLTMAGNEDCDIPELTAEFLLGGAQIEQPNVLDRN